MIPYCALEESALNWAGETALVSVRFGDISFETLLGRTSLLAGALRTEGLRRGDVLAALLPSCVEFIELYLASSALGVAFQPLDVRFAGDELRKALTCTGATAFATHASYANVEATLPDLALRLIVDGNRKGWREYESLLNSAIAPAPVANVSERDNVALFVFPSGPTDPGKCVPFTWAQLNFFPHDMIDLLGLGVGDRYVSLLPMLHATGPLAVNLCLISGCSYVISDTPSPYGIIDCLGEYRVTAVHTVPSVAELLLRGNPQKRDHSAMRVVALTGTDGPVELLTALEEAIPSAKAIQGYGPPEAASLLTLLPLERHADKRGSIGIPLSGSEIRLLGEGGQEVPTGEAGEIVVRGGKLFKGYHGSPDLTSSVMRDGWFHTGDMARVDEDGFYYHLGSREHQVGSRATPDEAG